MSKKFRGFKPNTPAGSRYNNVFLHINELSVISKQNKLE